ncbi:fluoride efflux transporter CrcB [Lutibacter holmesii]|uniref:Fluoride-specific ion channel FluC n=1 Tax=Lutibacter holmesii TaxID=1137985 RepID=A0ABW3WMC9_9FLAO
MKQALLVFVGGGLGSVVRYLLGKWLNNMETSIPYGTMLANILGSLIIGMVFGYLSKTSNLSHATTLFLVTGFCGGFTTFAAFAYENHLFLKSGDYLSFLPYTFGTLLLGFVAVFLGFYISKIV